MKQEVAKAQSSRLINPGMVILVTAGYKDKSTITPCAWHLPISKEPPSLGVALAKKHFSSELIKKSEEFIVNIPDWNLLDKLIACGKCSGREIDKFKESGLTSARANTLTRTPVIDECIGNIECSLFDVKDVGDHFLFFGEIIYAQAKQDYFAGGFWDTKKCDLIFHLGAKYFFKSSEYMEFGK